ncbi:MAG TPA: hypothetical protein VFO79_07030, partial [Xanthomonadales bacterium]|nr:hypothetical protein [Xanthomonadales bacterium]
LEVGDLAALEVEVEALSTDAVRLAPGSGARVIRWGGEPLPAHVVRVEPGGYTKISALGVEEQRVKVIVAIDAPRDAWRALGDGYRVEVEFVLAESAAALQVPSSAVFRHQGRWAVYVADGGRAQLRIVGIGQRAGLATEIVEGLREGERVVAFPDDQIADGARIDVARAASP